MPSEQETYAAPCCAALVVRFQGATFAMRLSHLVSAQKTDFFFVGSCCRCPCGAGVCSVGLSCGWLRRCRITLRSRWCRSRALKRSAIPRTGCFTSRNRRSRNLLFFRKRVTPPKTNSYNFKFWPCISFMLFPIIKTFSQVEVSAIILTFQFFQSK